MISSCDVWKFDHCYILTSCYISELLFIFISLKTQVTVNVVVGQYY